MPSSVLPPLQRQSSPFDLLTAILPIGHLQFLVPLPFNIATLAVHAAAAQVQHTLSGRVLVRQTGTSRTTITFAYRNLYTPTENTLVLYWPCANPIYCHASTITIRALSRSETALSLQTRANRRSTIIFVAAYLLGFIITLTSPSALLAWTSLILTAALYLFWCVSVKTRSALVARTLIHALEAKQQLADLF